MTFFETKSVGITSSDSDHGRIQGFTTQATMQTLFSLVSCAVLLVIIGYYNIIILAAYLFVTGLSTAWMSYFFRLRKSLDYEQFRVGVRNQNKLFEMMNGIVDIKVNTYEQYKIGEWNGMQEELYRHESEKPAVGANTKHGIYGHWPNTEYFHHILDCSEVVQGNLTLGMMMSISSIIGQVNGPLSQLIGFLQQYQDAKISLERSEEVYLCQNEDREDMKELTPERPPLDIRLENVTFRYTGSIGKAALENVSFTILPER